MDRRPRKLAWRRAPDLKLRLRIRQGQLDLPAGQLAPGGQHALHGLQELLTSARHLSIKHHKL